MRCKKLIYVEQFNYEGLPTKTKCLLGIITAQDSDFLTFKTANRELKIRLKYVISITETDQEFNDESDI